MKKTIMACSAAVMAAFSCPAAEPVAITPEKTLVVYYSWGGNTRAAAEQIHKLTGGTLLEIKPVTPYPTAYQACVDQAKKEIAEEFRPEISTKVEDIAKYDVIFVGSPNWWGTMAPPVATFLTRTDLAGKTVIPFFTHGGGGMQRCEADVKKLCGKSNVLKGATFSGIRVRKSAEEVEKFVRNRVVLP